VVPPTEGTDVVAAPDPQAAAELDSENGFSVAIGFADVSGRARGAVRLDVNKRTISMRVGVYAPEVRRWVRQVHWAETLDAVRDNPKLGTQPYDPE